MGAKFTKLHTRYPLTRFVEHLHAHGVTSPSSTACILAAARRIVRALDVSEGDAPPQVVWTDFERLKAYYDTRSENDQRQLAAAWIHLKAFAGATAVPRLGGAVGRTPTSLGPLAEALRRLLRNTPQSLHHILQLRWFPFDRSAPTRALVPTDGRGGRPYFTLPIQRPLLDAILTWGYGSPAECPEGAIFIPEYPGTDMPIRDTRILRAVRERVDPEAGAALDKALDAIRERAREEARQQQARIDAATPKPAGKGFVPEFLIEIEKDFRAQRHNLKPIPGTVEEPVHLSSTEVVAEGEALLGQRVDEAGAGEPRSAEEFAAQLRAACEKQNAEDAKLLAFLDEDDASPPEG